MTDETTTAIAATAIIGGFIGIPLLTREALIGQMTNLLVRKQQPELPPYVWNKDTAIQWARMQCNINDGSCAEIYSWRILLDIYTLNYLIGQLNNMPDLAPPIEGIE